MFLTMRSHACMALLSCHSLQDELQSKPLLQGMVATPNSSAVPAKRKLSSTGKRAVYKVPLTQEPVPLRAVPAGASAAQTIACCLNNEACDASSCRIVVTKKHNAQEWRMALHCQTQIICAGNASLLQFQTELAQTTMCSESDAIARPNNREVC